MILKQKRHSHPEWEKETEWETERERERERDDQGLTSNEYIYLPPYATQSQILFRDIFAHAWVKICPTVLFFLQSSGRTVDLLSKYVIEQIHGD